jgi:hypothetical protein
MPDNERFLRQMRRLYDARGLAFKPEQVEQYWERLQQFTDSEIVVAVDRALDEVAPDFGIVDVAVLLRFAREARARLRPQADRPSYPPMPTRERWARFGELWREALGNIPPAPAPPAPVHRLKRELPEPATEKNWADVAAVVAKIIGPR